MKRILLEARCRRGTASAALAAALLAGPSASAGVPAGAEAGELWFVLELDGRPAGWAVERWWSGDGTVVTESELTVRVARGEAGLEVELAGRFEETDAGDPLLLWTRQALGSAPIETTYRFTPAGVVAESVQSGRRRSERLAAPEGEWLTPAQARRVAAAHHAAGAREYTVRSLQPLEGLEPVTVRRTRVDPGEGPATVRWREESSTAPGVVATVELDGEGEVVRSTTELLGLEATLRRVDRETALAGRSGAGLDGSSAPGPGPEVLVATLVRPDRPIPHSRQVREAVYDLSLADGTLPDLPSEGAQRVERRGDGLRVTVRRQPPPGAVAARPRPADADPLPRGSGDPGPAPDGDPGLVAASLYLDHEDPEVRRLLAAAFPEDADATPRTSGAGALAQALTVFVHGYVEEKGLDTGFATASEVARSRRGDCTEHAVLLAALLRAAGIPSRAVTGLVYLDDFAGAEEVFGYHMWVQAHVEGRWLDLDPTLPWGFDATHVALAVSDLAGPGGGTALERMLPLVGKLRIEVVEIRR